METPVLSSWSNGFFFSIITSCYYSLSKTAEIKAAKNKQNIKYTERSVIHEEFSPGNAADMTG